MTIGCFLSCEEFGPRELVEQRGRAERRRVHAAVDLRPLPPVERRAGPQPVRVVGDRRASRRRPSCRSTTARDLPDVRIHPAIIAQAAATTARHARRAASRSASAPARRSTSTSSATAGRAADVRLEMLEEAVEVMRRLWTGEHVEPPRRRTTPSRTPASTTCPRAAAVIVVGLRPEGGRARGADRRRVLHHVAGQGARSSRYREAGGTGPVHGRDQGVLGRRRGRGAEDRAPAVAQRRRCPASCAQVLPTPRALRAGRASW